MTSETNEHKNRADNGGLIEPIVMVDYKEKYLSLSSQYVREVTILSDALRDFYNSHCGQPKSCGHEYFCVCPGDKAKELIELYCDDEP